MSWKSYNGGGSMLSQNGSWSSYDPAETNDGPAETKDTVMGYKTKTKKNQKKITEMKGATRLEVMHHILNQHLKNIDNPTLPKSVQEHILAEITKHNSTLEWVKNQSNYEKVLLKKQKNGTHEKNNAK